MPELVERDRHREAHDHERDADDERKDFHTLTVPAPGFELGVTASRRLVAGMPVDRSEEP
ncbi:hypothetical protein GCM10025773_36080 [Microbacterium jejuense]